MPINRTKRTRARTGSLDHWRVDQLITGQYLLAGVGYISGPEFTSSCNYFTPEQHAVVRSLMEADWAIHGPANIYNTREEYAERGLTVPWAAREFGLPPELAAPLLQPLTRQER